MDSGLNDPSYNSNTSLYFMAQGTQVVGFDLTRRPKRDLIPTDSAAVWMLFRLLHLNCILLHSRLNLLVPSMDWLDMPWLEDSSAWHFHSHSFVFTQHWFVQILFFFSSFTIKRKDNATQWVGQFSFIRQNPLHRSNFKTCDRQDFRVWLYCSVSGKQCVPSQSFKS